MKLNRLTPLLLGAAPVLGLQVNHNSKCKLFSRSAVSLAAASNDNTASKTKLTVGLCQISVGADKSKNIIKAQSMISDAHKRGGYQLTNTQTYKQTILNLIFF